MTEGKRSASEASCVSARGVGVLAKVQGEGDEVTTRDDKDEEISNGEVTKIPTRIDPHQKKQLQMIQRVCRTSHRAQYVWNPQKNDDGRSVVAFDYISFSTGKRKNDNVEALVWSRTSGKIRVSFSLKC